MDIHIPAIQEIWTWFMLQPLLIKIPITLIGLVIMFGIIYYCYVIIFISKDEREY